MTSTTSTDTFAHASKMIATALGADVEQQIMKYAHTVAIDSRTQFMLFPSNVEYHPLGLMIQSFDASGGVDSEVPVGLFSEWSFALGVIEHVLRQQARSEHERKMVTHTEIEVGDLIESLGFTVTRVDHGTKGTWLYDGTGQQILLRDGYEYEVYRSVFAGSPE